MKKYVIGVDFGTDSCRALLVDTENGKEIASEVSYYPRWKKSLFCDPKANRYRQHPLDYIESLSASVRTVTSRTEPGIISNITAISIAATGSTPCAVDEKGMPLALKREFYDNPNAMFILWKDHTSIKEAEEITSAAKNAPVDYTKYSGGTYSSEWFFAKALRVLREDENVRAAAYTFTEHCDWIPAYLTAVGCADNIKRSRCSAGHKAMWNEEFGGFPPHGFFESVDPLLTSIRKNMSETTFTSNHCAGVMSDVLADSFGLPRGIKVGIGAIDAHMGAVGANIKPRVPVKVMGTSTCDMFITEGETFGTSLVDGICGQVNGSIVPQMIGLEAGQSAFGDVYAWYKRLLSYPLSMIPNDKLSEADIKAIEDGILKSLEEAAEKIHPAENTVAALDWFNGRRTPNADERLTGALTGLTLSSDAPSIYRALLECTAYGARAITEKLYQYGIETDYIIAIGGICKKSPLSMQILSDVLNKPIKVCVSEQTVALGAAIFAAVISNIYPDTLTAQQKMASPIEKVYNPNDKKREIYTKKYQSYKEIGKFTENSYK